jgi:WD40 repeat protein
MDHPPVYSALPVVTSLDFSPDGGLLAVSGYHEVLIHTADGSEIVARLVGLSERIESAVFSPDGKYLAVTGGSPCRMGEVQVWNVEKKQLKFSQSVTYDTVYGADWSDDGKLVSFGCSDNTLRAVDAKTGKQVFFQGAHNDWVLDSVFSVKGTHLVSVSRDGSMKLNEVATQRFVDNITTITPALLRGGLICVDRHPTKDELLASGADGVPEIYRMFREQARKIGDDFNLIRKFDPLPGRVYSVCYSDDGTRIAAASSFNGTGEVRVYQADDGKLVWKFEYPGGGLFAVTFHPDGKSLATGGFDGTVYLIDAEKGDIIKQFPAAPMAAGQVASVVN